MSIVGERLDAANAKLMAIKGVVKEIDLDKLCKRNEFNKYDVCSRVTYYKYAKGEGSNEDLADNIFRKLSKILSSRGIDVDSLVVNVK